MPAEFEGFDFDQATWLAWSSRRTGTREAEYGWRRGTVSRTQPSLETLSGEKEGIPTGASEIVKGTEIWVPGGNVRP